MTDTNRVRVLSVSKQQNVVGAIVVFASEASAVARAIELSAPAKHDDRVRPRP